jgi:hypothetical protein
MYPAPGQRAAIKAREGLELCRAPATTSHDGGKVTLNFKMPVHSVALLVLSPSS